MVAPGLKQVGVEPVTTTGQAMPSFSNLWVGKVIIYCYLSLSIVILHGCAGFRTGGGGAGRHHRTGNALLLQPVGG